MLIECGATLSRAKQTFYSNSAESFATAAPRGPTKSDRPSGLLPSVKRRAHAILKNLHTEAALPEWQDACARDACARRYKSGSWQRAANLAANAIPGRRQCGRTRRSNRSKELSSAFSISTMRATGNIDFSLSLDCCSLREGRRWHKFLQSVRFRSLAKAFPGETERRVVVSQIVPLPAGHFPLRRMWANPAD